MYDFADDLLADEEWDYPDDDPSSGCSSVSEPNSEAEKAAISEQRV